MTFEVFDVDEDQVVAQFRYAHDAANFASEKNARGYQMVVRRLEA